LRTKLHSRKRTILARTDTIRYKYSSTHTVNIDTDTSTPCIVVTQPLLSLDQQVT